jgi:hypothetical protein
MGYDFNKLVEEIFNEAKTAKDPEWFLAEAANKMTKDLEKLLSKIGDEHGEDLYDVYVTYESARKGPGWCVIQMEFDEYDGAGTYEAYKAEVPKYFDFQLGSIGKVSSSVRESSFLDVDILLSIDTDSKGSAPKDSVVKKLYNKAARMAKGGI